MRWPFTVTSPFVKRPFPLGSWAAALFSLAGASACLRASQERAERDLDVGKGELAQASIVVEDGLAVVRALESGQIELWSSAPSFTLHVHRDPGAPARWTIALRNCMPDAELRSTATPPLDVVAETETLPTRKRWQVDLPPGDSAFRLATPDQDRPEPFRFALLSDIQEAIDRLVDIHRKLNEDKTIRFLLGAGDLTQQGTPEQLERYQRELEQLHVPYYTTLGNHELGVNPTRWHDYFGRASLRFTFHDAQFSLLDSGSASIDPLVYDRLEGWLEEGRNRVHVVAMHIPPIDPIGVRNGSFASRNEAAKLLARLAAGQVDLTLYGHIHSFYAFDNAGIPAYISGGGGAIPERFDGIGRHFLAIDVDPARGIQQTTVVRVD
jgi:Icc protein